MTAPTACKVCPSRRPRCPYCTSELEPVPAPAEPASAEASPLERERRLRKRYGGFSWGATFIGFVVASFLTLVFLAIVGAIVAGIGYQMGARAPTMGGALSATSRTLGLGGLVGALLAVALAYGLGGYTAGRMARFDGVKNGLGVVLWTIALGIILGIGGAVLATRVTLISHLHLPGTMPLVTISGVIGLAIALLVMLLASMLGGRRGVDYHRKIDRFVQPQGQRPAA